MIGFTDAQKLTGLSRAARLVAATYADDSPRLNAVITEARADDDGLLILAMSLAVTAAHFAREAHGDDAQFAVDAWAVDAGFYRDRELGRSAGD